MLYIFLIIIAIFLYLIYRRLKPKAVSDEESMYIEHGAENVENFERILLERMEERKDAVKKRIEEGDEEKDFDFDLEEWVSALSRVEGDERTFYCNKKNFVRLSERFKHDKLKLIEVTKDWCDYLSAYSHLFYESMLFVYGTDEQIKKLNDERDAYIIKMEEVEKRFKNLLGSEYVNSDPYSFKVNK